MSMKTIDALLNEIVKASITLAKSGQGDEEQRQDDLARRIRSTSDSSDMSVLVDEEEEEEAEKPEPSKAEKAPEEVEDAGRSRAECASSRSGSSSLRGESLMVRARWSWALREYKRRRRCAPASRRFRPGTPQRRRGV